MVNYLDADRVQFWHGIDIHAVRVSHRQLRMEERFLHYRISGYAVVLYVVVVRL